MPNFIQRQHTRGSPTIVEEREEEIVVLTHSTLTLIFLITFEPSTHIWDNFENIDSKLPT